MLQKLLFFIKRIIVRISNSNLELGSNVKIDLGTNLNLNKGKVTIGDNVYLRSIQKGYQAGMPFPTTLLVDVEEATIKVGKNCRINGAYIHAQKSISIGENCVIASGVNIIDSNGHQVKSKNRTIGRDIPQEIIIGNNVWIGLNCIILKGTTIGDNSIISAGCIVKGKIPNNSFIKNGVNIIEQIEY